MQTLEETIEAIRAAADIINKHLHDLKEIYHCDVKGIADHNGDISFKIIKGE